MPTINFVFIPGFVKLGKEVKIWNQVAEWLFHVSVFSCLGKKIGAKWNTQVLEKEANIKQIE